MINFNISNDDIHREDLEVIGISGLVRWRAYWSLPSGADFKIFLHHFLKGNMSTGPDFDDDG